MQDNKDKRTEESKKVNPIPGSGCSACGRSEDSASQNEASPYQNYICCRCTELIIKDLIMRSRGKISADGERTAGNSDRHV